MVALFIVQAIPRVSCIINDPMGFQYMALAQTYNKRNWKLTGYIVIETNIYKRLLYKTGPYNLPLVLVFFPVGLSSSIGLVVVAGFTIEQLIVNKIMNKLVELLNYSICVVI